MMKLLTVLLVYALMLPSAALACSCMRFKDAQAHIDQTDVIVEGNAIETHRGIGRDAELYVTSFKITRSWKGDRHGDLQVQHKISGGANCGIDFEPGHKYTVFAVRLDDGGLYTSSCLAMHFEWPKYEAILGADKSN